MRVARSDGTRQAARAAAARVAAGLVAAAGLFSWKVQQEEGAGDAAAEEVKAAEAAVPVDPV